MIFRRSLRSKLVLLLFLASTIPFIASIVLVDRISLMIQNFASNEAAAVGPHLEAAEQGFRENINLTKKYYRDAIAIPLIHQIQSASTKEQQDTMIRQAKQSTPAIAGLTLESSEVGPRSWTWSMAGPVWHIPAAELPAGSSMTLAIDSSAQENLQAVGRARKQLKRVETFRQTMPSSYKYAFIAFLSSVVLVVITFGFLIAHLMTKRIRSLAHATNSVAQGDLRTRVDVVGQDEVSMLAHSFNSMVHSLERQTSRVAYLERLNAWKEIARRLAHEIKNPLTPIRLAVEQCVSKYPGDDPKYSNLLEQMQEIVGEEIDHLEHLVNEFRGLSQLPEPKMSALELCDFLENMEKNPVLKDNLTITTPKHPITVYADKFLLKQVIINLVDNALEAMEEAKTIDPTVSIHLVEEADAVSILVEDNGPGVDDTLAERIFEPYVTGKETGTGLGLAIAKKTCIDHGGHLALEGRSKLGGACFSITLPLPDVEIAAAQP